MTGNSVDKSKGVKALINASGNAVGSAAGVALGFLFGPPGALAGVAVGPFVAQGVIEAANDIYERVLSVKEKERVGTVIAYAAARMKVYEERGEESRLEKSDASEKKSFEEIAEGVLISAQRESEEKKIKYLEQEKREKSDLMRELLQRTAEIKAFLENKPGLFKFFGK